MASMTTIPPLTLTAAVTFPTAGVGGSYYDTDFGVPTYPGALSDRLTWRLIDVMNCVNINFAATRGVAAGLVWAVLVYLLALTPTRKRTTPFHALLLVGVLFMLVHLMVDIVSAVAAGVQPISTYIVLTGDTTSSVWPGRLIATFAVSQVAAWFAFGFAAVCLWLQARALMTGLAVHFPATVHVVLAYLALSSVAAIAVGMVFDVRQIRQIGHSPDPTQQNDSGLLRVAYLAAYAVCIGSFSLVSICSVVYIICKRPSSVVRGGGTYASALNLIGLLCAQSFIIPFVFCILQVIPGQAVFFHPEVLLLPAVYLNLPLGSLFMTVNSADQEEHQKVVGTSLAAGPRGPAGDRSPALLDGAEQPAGSSRPNSCLLDGHRRSVGCSSQLEREIDMMASLDSMLIESREADTARNARIKTDVASSEKTVV